MEMNCMRNHSSRNLLTQLSLFRLAIISSNNYFSVLPAQTNEGKQASKQATCAQWFRRQSEEILNELYGSDIYGKTVWQEIIIVPAKDLWSGKDMGVSGGMRVGAVGKGKTETVNNNFR